MINTIRLAMLVGLLVAATQSQHGQSSRKPCIPTRNTPECSIDLGEIKKGTIIRPWVRVKNIGDSDTTFTVQCVQGGIRVHIAAGQEITGSLCSINTLNFSGPIQKMAMAECDPPALVQVVLYESLEACLADGE